MTEKEESSHSAEVGTVRSLQETPTWALATVCFLFVAVSMFLERLINLLSIRLKKNRKTSLLEALEKLKSVLMVLGFMSLMLNVTEGEVSNICIPIKYANRMLPCRKTISLHDNDNDEADEDDDHHDNFFHHCSKGKTSLISQEGLTQLSFFIFVLACMHILYNLAVLLLGMAKMRKWKSWEKETQTVEYLTSNDPNRFRMTRDTTFARRHLSSWTETSMQLWIKCFFRQFFNSVAKIDYLTLRHGFIFAHLSSNNAFNFQKYIQRSLHEDFKTIVGISPLMWLTVVIFMLLDVYGWRVYFYMSFVPLIVVLVIGTKLEMIVAKMAVTIKEHNNVIRGSPLVEPNDKHFWFSNPRFLLSILHYTLFLNTFEMAFFVWITWQFGINSCYHDNREIIITRIVLAVTVQVLSSYITLPLYALVTQMGSSYKRVILEEQIANVFRQWHGRVRVKRKIEKTPETNNDNDNNGDIDLGESPTQSEVANDFGSLGKQPHILQEIPVHNQTER
ncbi:PREDICTED: MLO-like protein 3 isoform X1 [Camelina sativa]|uniref:MLO-like protein n=2 Tax=Camelina sativa TaxID=90675 RepID=A0ABM0TG85_CAMSA|nr:PREDICTED: MLO-like protein 3 isoform X1 [Camelina sativa]